MPASYLLITRHSEGVRFSDFEVSEDMLSIWVSLASMSQQKMTLELDVFVHGVSKGDCQFASTSELNLPFKCNEEEEVTWELS